MFADLDFYIVPHVLIGLIMSLLAYSENCFLVGPVFGCMSETDEHANADKLISQPNISVHADLATADSVAMLPAHGFILVPGAIRQLMGK